MATKPQGTTKNLGQFHFHVTSLVRNTFEVALLRYVVEMTLEMHFTPSMLFCNYASNNLDECAVVLRFCYKNILNG
jgi:hypothetical protein